MPSHSDNLSTTKEKETKDICSTSGHESDRATRLYQHNYSDEGIDNGITR